MKHVIYLFAISLCLVSCDKDEPTPLAPVTAELVSDLSAQQTGGQGQPIGGAFAKFDFSTGTSTTSDTDWDIAFRGTTIAINGGAATGTTDEPTRNGQAGAAIVSGTFSSVTDAKDVTFASDSADGFAIPTGSDNGWYNYNFMTNIISPIPGKILVFKTRAGHYAKVEILSYYQGAPSAPSATDTGRYYTFNYVYNPNMGETSLE